MRMLTDPNYFMNSRLLTVENKIASTLISFMFHDCCKYVYIVPVVQSHCAGKTPTTSSVWLCFMPTVKERVPIMTQSFTQALSFRT